MKSSQSGHDKKDGEVDLNDHVDVLVRKYDDSLAARDYKLCLEYFLG